MLLLLLLKYYPEKKKNVECLLLKKKQKRKKVPKGSEQWFKKRTWLEKQAILWPVMQGSSICLNLLKYARMRDIFLDICNVVNMAEYAWNITDLIKPDF